MNLGHVSVKQFGNKNDYLVKFEKKNSSNPNLISEIKKMALFLGKGCEINNENINHN